MEKRLELGLLWELQKLEQEMEDLETSTKKIPKALQIIDAEVEAARAEHKALEERGKDIDRERQDCENNIEEERDRLRKAQAKQLEIKTNKEYSALLQEIEGHKTNIDGFETRILELMESAEALAEEVGREAVGLREKESEAEGRRGEIKEELAQLENRLSQLREDRKRISVEIDPEWLDEYERIKLGRGSAIAGLNGNACGACNQSVLPKLLHDVKHGDEIKTCLHCNRILYAPEEAETSAEAAKPAEPTQA